MVNKVFLVGHLGDAPAPHTFADGGMLATASLATNEHWRDARTGDRVERTEWHRLVFRARTAEVAAQYLRKGAKIFVEGQLRTRKWQAEDGADRYVTEVHVRQMQMLDRKQDAATHTPSVGYADSSPGGGAKGRNAYADAREGRTPMPAPAAGNAGNHAGSPLSDTPPAPESTPYAYQMPPDADDIPF